MEDSLQDYLKLLHKNGATREEKPKSKELLATAHKQIQSQKTAQKIVEFLIEGKLRPQILFRCLQHLNQDLYQDVVEERAISKLCGYPLCGKKIENVSKQQFCINSKKNVVYDIREVKNYCSSICYNASLYLKNQIDNSPLWLRTPETSTNFTLLSDINEKLPEVQLIPKVNVQKNFTPVSTFATASLNELNDKSAEKLPTVAETANEADNNSEELKNIERTPDVTENSNKDDNASIELENKEVDHSIDQPSSSSSKKNQSPKAVTSRKVPSKTDIIKAIKECVQNWFTLETYIYLHGMARIEDVLKELNMEEELLSLQKQLGNEDKYLKCKDICRRLQMQEIKENKNDRIINSDGLKPVPVYDQLLKESKIMQVKVKAFYSGTQFNLESGTQNCINKKESCDKTEKKEEVNEEEPFVLPTNSAKTLRQNIYINSLYNPIRTIATKLNVDYVAVLNCCNDLVKTFNFQANNTYFKPAMCNVIAVVLIEITGVRDPSIRKQLESPPARNFINAIFSKIPGGETFLRDILDDVKDLEGFMQKYFKK